MNTARSPRNDASRSVKCSPTASHESMSVRSKGTVSKSGCSRREMLMISVSGQGQVRASASPMPDVAPVIHTMFRCSPTAHSSSLGDVNTLDISSWMHPERAVGSTMGGGVSDEEARLAAWIERTVGGRVVGVTRRARWRPAWDVDVEVDGRLLPLHARGEREPRIVMPYRIADEVATHDLLEGHGLPVPHAYGLCDDPYALVMDRLRGHVDLSFVADTERERLLDEYLVLLARIYEIPLSAAASAGFALPADSAATGLGGYWRRMEALYDPLMEGLPADPMAVFLRGWLRDNVPRTGTPRRGSSPTTRSSSCSTRAASRGCSTSSTRTSATP